MGKFDPLGLVTPEPSEQAQMFNLYQRDWWLLMLKTLDAVAANTGAGGAASSSQAGPAEAATSQTALNAIASVAIAVARPTRRTCLVRNLDAAISIYVGESGVTTATGMLIKAGESFVVAWVGEIHAISASGTPSVAVWDEYD